MAKRWLDSNPSLPYNRQVNHLKEDDMKRFHDSHLLSSAFRLSFFRLIPYTVILIPLFVLPAFSQQRWERNYGGTSWDDGRSVQQTSDGGYIVAGGFNRSDLVYLIKTNALGDTLWTRTYDGGIACIGYCVQQTSDGGYIVAGWEKESVWDLQVYLIKTNATGDILWTRSYGGAHFDYGFSVQQTQDGGYIVAGLITLDSPDFVNVYLIKTNSSGDTLWTRTYGGGGDDYGWSVQQTQDGGYIVAGETNSFGNSLQVYLIKTNSSGDTLWTKTYGGTGNDLGYSVQQTADGGYIVAGYTKSFGDSSQVYLIKTNALGDTLWTKNYGGSGEDYGCSVHQTMDDGYIVAGYTSSFGNWVQVYLIKTNPSGDTLWSKCYGRDSTDFGYSVQQTADGGYIVAGETASFGNSMQVYLIKTDANGNVGIENNKGFEEPRGQGLKITPNPFVSFATVPGHEAERFSLYDISGRKVGTYKGDRVGEGLGAGVYFLRPEGGKAKPVRIVKLR
jgi:hypothetical protein